MSDDNKTKDTLFDGGVLHFRDVAALSIATVLFIAQGNEKILDAIGEMADSIKEGLNADEETTDEQQHD
jgi:uncharacterized protein with PhoU and TrkA domain